MVMFVTKSAKLQLVKPYNPQEMPGGIKCQIFDIYSFTNGLINNIIIIIISKQ